MNLQRREEILALLAAPVTGEVGQALKYRDALMECRDHIDALEQAAAERVIADGSRGPGVVRAVVAPERAAWLTIDEMANALVLEFGTPLAAARGFAKAIADASIAKGSRAITANCVLGEALTCISLCSRNSASSKEECGKIARTALWQSKYGPERIAWELDETASGRAYYGNALRVAKDFPGITPEERGVLDAWLTGRATFDPKQNFSWPLQEIAAKLRAIPADRVPGEGMAALRRFAERCAQRDHQPDEHIGSAKCVACEAEDALRANQGEK